MDLTPAQELEVKKLLTEVLMRVTSELFQEIALEVTEEAVGYARGPRRSREEKGELWCTLCSSFPVLLSFCHFGSLLVVGTVVAAGMCRCDFLEWLTF